MFYTFVNIFISIFQIRLVNISSNDIVDGNPKLTLGLLWAIILHWQVCKILLISFTQIFLVHITKFIFWC